VRLPGQIRGAALGGTAWQSIPVPLSEMRPNPYFQPSDARRGASLDVSDVVDIGLARQDSASGRLAVGRIVVVR